MVSRSDSEALFQSQSHQQSPSPTSSGIFQATSHLAPCFSNDNDAFWEYSDGCNSNLVFGHITPQEQLNRKTFHRLGLSPDRRSQTGINKKGTPIGSRRSRKGPALLILEPQCTLSVVQTGLRNLEAGFNNLGTDAMCLPPLCGPQTKVFLFPLGNGPQQLPSEWLINKRVTASA